VLVFSPKVAERSKPKNCTVFDGMGGIGYGVLKFYRLLIAQSFWIVLELPIHILFYLACPMVDSAKQTKQNEKRNNWFFSLITMYGTYRYLRFLSTGTLLIL
jgi:hypothetical protein